MVKLWEVLFSELLVYNNNSGLKLLQILSALKVNKKY